jgi:plastocyanin
MRRGRPVLAAWLCAALGAPTALEAGTIKGTLAVLEKDGRPAKDVSDAVVWVEGPKARAREAQATVVMKGKAFLPRVTVIGAGGTVEFPNQDGIFHNVFSVSGQNAFDLQLYKKPKSASKTFEHPGVVRVYCNIHPQMSAFVLVRDNPYWARVGPDGSFQIEGVPAGSWTLKAWHERSGESAQPIEVRETGLASATLSLDASKWKRAPHKNKFGKDYEVGEKY